MSNTTHRRLTKEDENLLQKLFEQADAPQKKSFLENLPALPITTFTGLVGASNVEAQIFSSSFPTSSPYNKTNFAAALRTYVAWSVRKSKEKSVGKGGLLSVENSQEMEQLLLRLRQKEAVLQTIKMSEEVTKLRIANKKDSETSLSIDMLLPLLSECFGNAANNLRALAMFYPDSVNAVNDCIESFIVLGRRLIGEAKADTERYLTEFQTTEENLQAILLEIAELSLAVSEQQEQELVATTLAFGDQE